MEVLTILLRTLLIYFVVFGIMRLMGKREIGKLSIFDLVISIMIAELAVLVIEDTSKALWQGLLPMATLVFIQIMIAYVTLKNRTLRRLFEGVPSLLIYKGKVNRDEMKKQRYNIDDLMLQLRENKITNIADVEFALLETSGKLSVIENEEHSNNQQDGKNNGSEDEKRFNPFSHSDKPTFKEGNMFDKVRYEGLPLPLILDGKVQDENLSKIGQNRFWLKNQVQKKGSRDFKEVFICTIDHRGHLYLDKKRPR
jgi:uncharacterized membrane protein YcaP (DUF421 family)